MATEGELEDMAAEELEAACRMSWREMAKIVPWGDSYPGFAPSGRHVEVERSYLWADGEGGDILVEVVVSPNAVLYDHGARCSRRIPAPSLGGRSRQREET